MAPKQNTTDINVDAVITWVDGNDPIWQSKFNQFSPKKINFDERKSRLRYNSIGEINIAISSIIKFASFVNTIYLVTDNQVPEGFDVLKKNASQKGINLEIVDHKVIFRGFEEHLPTFNSCSIGCMLYRIPNLAEHFIVFNDDTFLMRETNVNDFFTDGKPIIRGKKELFRENRKVRKYYYEFLEVLHLKPKERTSSFKHFQETSAKLAYENHPPAKYIRRFHTPVCIRRSTLSNFFETHKILEENISHRFRNKDQFIISSLSEHLEFKENKKNFTSNIQLTYFRSYKSKFKVKRNLKKFENDKNKLFMTFQSLDMADEQILNYITKWIQKRIQTT
ncbi:Stealth CR1 domain-containing protein [Nonlabens marinus]|uniref:Glycosyltransferase n=1 Tax=Nonlabens marinus S1-08 TaxID=1454201 RepID=W8VVM7_9FLAO|nr:Stealth CR1 domain-containing protein [Nonlabens marinus]BAO55588.1 glycosyltransferase [Nonlabens marinus S1-08]